MTTDDTDAAHGVTEEAIWPHTDYPLDPPENDVPTRAEHLRDEAAIGKAMDAIDDLHAADDGVDDRDRLVAFGRRMTTLVYHGGLAPSEAKAKAAVDVFRTPSRTLGDIADMLGISRGGLSRLKGKAATKAVAARRLHYMRVDRPMNLVFDEHIAAEAPADYETRYVLLEAVDPRTEPEAATLPNGRQPPETVMRPPEPQYALVREIHAPSGAFDRSKDPDDRSYGTFQEMEMAWLVDGDEVVDYLYADEYFESEERAEFWHDLLDTHGFDPKVVPRERINPDVLMEEDW